MATLQELFGNVGSFTTNPGTPIYGEGYDYGAVSEPTYSNPQLQELLRQAALQRGYNDATANWISRQPVGFENGKYSVALGQGPGSTANRDVFDFSPEGTLVGTRQISSGNEGWSGLDKLMMGLGMAGIGYAAAPMLLGSAGATAGAIEGAAGLPELGLAAQTGTGAASSTAGLGGLAGGVAGGTGLTAAPAIGGLEAGLAAPAASSIGGGALGTGLTASAAGANALMPSLSSAGQAALTGAGLSGLANTVSNIAKPSNNNTDGWLAAILNAISQNKQGNVQQEWADKLYQDRKQFLDRLAASYTNPAGVLQGDEYQAIAGTVLDQLQRKDAARGRLATDVQRQKLMQDHAWEWLGKYRSGLASAAGLQGTSGLPELDKSGTANEWGTLNALLSQMSRGQTNGSFDINNIIDTIGDWF